MKLVDDCTDFGCPEIWVTGASAIDRISANMIRESYFSRRRDGSVEVVHVVWDKDAWRKHCELLNRLCEQILAEPPQSGDDDHPSRHAH
jgi:hypothetical protein